jgi:hypothetical protein
MLESNPSLRTMPEQKASAGFIAAGAFTFSVLAYMR